VPAQEARSRLVLLCLLGHASQGILAVPGPRGIDQPFS
jgi:hypothetical protein